MCGSVIRGIVRGGLGACQGRRADGLPSQFDFYTLVERF